MKTVLLLVLVGCGEITAMPFGDLVDARVDGAGGSAGTGGAGDTGGAGGATPDAGAERTNTCGVNGAPCATGTCSPAGTGVNYQCFEGECIAGPQFSCGTRGCFLTSDPIPQVNCNPL